MDKLLYVESSPRKGRSASIKVAEEFLSVYHKLHPSDKIETLDVWSYPLPEFNGAAINAKYKIMHGEKHLPEEQTAWKRITAIVENFKEADKYVFSIPMWNFGIPYKLKHFIDVINQPGQTFSYTPGLGYKGLVSGKPAVVIYSRGGSYSDADTLPLDHQKPYFDEFLRFIGFTDIKNIVVEPTLRGPELAEKTKNEALIEAQKLARSF